jgi:diacylglycerol kinase family enzyme
MRKGKKIKVSSDVPLPVHFDGELFEPNVKEVTVSIVPHSAYVIGRWDN